MKHLLFLLFIFTAFQGFSQSKKIMVDGKFVNAKVHFNMFKEANIEFEIKKNPTLKKLQ